jgi:D-alanyl-D-alanine carboxypeptidase
VSRLAAGRSHAHRVSKRRAIRHPRGSGHSRLARAVVYALAAVLVVAGAVVARSSIPLDPSAALGLARPATNVVVAAPLPACRSGEMAAPRAGYDDWDATLVDTAFRLPAGYEPPDLVPVGRASIQGGGQIRALVVDDLRELSAAARSAGARLRVVSAYRSESTQADVLAETEKRVGTEAALAVTARPGHSEHQLGTAIDFGTTAEADPWEGDWGKSPEGEWLADEAWRFGFVLSYPQGSSPALTCYSYEPWHFRYVGHAAAAAIHGSRESPREYLWRFASGASSRDAG